MEKKIFSGKAAKSIASSFHYGNIISIVIPVLIPIWFGATIILYAMNRQNPNPRVGFYIQWGAYTFYALVGLIIPVATFFPPEIKYYLYLWGALLAIMVPVSIYFLIRISQEEWQDIEYEA
ncbi:MAG: hypothetical protein ACWA5X_04755 [bacterium]